MQKLILVTHPLVLLLPSVLVGQERESRSNDDPLPPIAYVVGGTWAADGEISGIGKYSAERSYHWVLGRKFVEQRHVMKFSETEMETMGIIGWNPEKKAIAAWGFGSDGGLATSHVTAANHKEIQMEGTRVELSPSLAAVSSCIPHTATSGKFNANLTSDLLSLVRFQYAVIRMT